MKKLIYLIIAILTMSSCERDGNSIGLPSGSENKGALFFTLNADGNAINDIHVYAFDIADGLVHHHQYYSSPESLSSDMFLVDGGDYTFVTVVNLGKDFDPTSDNEDDEPLTLNDLTRYLYKFSDEFFLTEMYTGSIEASVVNQEIEEVTIYLKTLADGVSIVADIVFDKDVDFDITVSPALESRGYNFSSTKVWTATVSDGDEEWCTLSVDGGEASDFAKLTITASASDVHIVRKATITIKSDEVEKEIELTQKQLDVVIIREIEAEDMKFISARGELSMTVAANIDIEIDDIVMRDLDGVSIDWIETPTIVSTEDAGKLTERTLKFVIKNNETFDDRFGKIIVTSGDEPEFITITQDRLDKLDIDVDGDGGSATVDVAAGGLASLEINIDANRGFSLDLSHNWMEQISRTVDGDIETRKFKVLANRTHSERKGKILLTGINNQTTTVTINQKKYDENITLRAPAERNVYFKQGRATKRIEFYSTRTFTIPQIYETWLELEDFGYDEETGIGYIEVIVNEVPNSDIKAARAADITIISAAIRQEISFLQSHFIMLGIKKKRFIIDDRNQGPSVPSHDETPVAENFINTQSTSTTWRGEFYRYWDASAKCTGAGWRLPTTYEAELIVQTVNYSNGKSTITVNGQVCYIPQAGNSVLGTIKPGYYEGFGYYWANDEMVGRPGLHSFMSFYSNSYVNYMDNPVKMSVRCVKSVTERGKE